MLMTEAATVSYVKSPLTWELQSVPETPLVSGGSWAEPQAESRKSTSSKPPRRALTGEPQRPEQQKNNIRGERKIVGQGGHTLAF